MAPNVLTVTSEELLARREELLKQAGMTREELQARAETYSLNGEEWEIGQVPWRPAVTDSALLPYLGG